MGGSPVGWVGYRDSITVFGFGAPVPIGKNGAWEHQQVVERFVCNFDPKFGDPWGAFRIWEAREHVDVVKDFKDTYETRQHRIGMGAVWR